MKYVASIIESVGVLLVVAGMFLSWWKKNDDDNLLSLFSMKETKEGDSVKYTEKNIPKAKVYSTQIVAVLAVVLMAGSLFGISPTYKIYGLSFGTIGVVLGAVAYVLFYTTIKKTLDDDEQIEAKKMASGSYLWLGGHVVLIGGLVYSYMK